VFRQHDFPEIGYHIGLDLGFVESHSFGAVDIAASNELIGESMNLTAKIESKAGHNGILLGRRLFEFIHSYLQGMCESADIAGWTYKDPDVKTRVYPLYRCVKKWNC
jgi:class 3 adenylate cyclase